MNWIFDAHIFHQICGEARYGDKIKTQKVPSSKINNNEVAFAMKFSRCSDGLNYTSISDLIFGTAAVY